MSAPAISARPAVRSVANRNTAPQARPATTQAGASPARTSTVATDSANLSSVASTAPASNPYNGVAAGVTSVTVEPWSPGNNSKSTLDGILQSQGYSPEEIYGKGDDGKSLLDRVSAVNDLKNPNLIHPDQKLKIPMKEAPEEAGATKQEASVSSSDVAEGETTQTLVRNEDQRMSTKTTVAKGEDGSVGATMESRNHENPDASLTTGMVATPGGKIVSTSEETKDGIETVTMGRNADGSAVTVQDQAVTSNGSDVSITDADDNKNMIGAVADDQLIVMNPGTTEGSGGVASAVDLSEKSNDGMFENWGRNVAEFFGVRGEEQQKPVSFDQTSGVLVQRGNEGETSVLVERQGEVQKVYGSAGDTDDSWLERGGESVDNFFNNMTPDVARSEDPNYKLTRRGYRRVNSSTQEATQEQQIPRSEDPNYKLTRRGYRRVN